MVLTAALKTWGAVQTSLSINLIEWIHPPCNMMPSPYISVLFFQLFTLVSSNLWFPFRLAISLSSSCPYCLPTFPHPQTFNSQHTCTLFVLIRYSSYPVHSTLLLYDEYASVELHLRLMKGVLIKDSGINTAARFGMPSPFSQGNLSSISLIYATIRSLLFLVLCHQHLKHQIYKTIIISVIIIVKRILIP